MLRKKQSFTVITPIPAFIPRQLALDILHSHSEVITLNPLVLSHKPIPAPRNATADEYYSTWYEITQRVQVVPGMGNIGSRKIVFNGCFQDMPWGLQTHVYAPFDIDMRSKYRIAGNQPGVEPPEPQEVWLQSLGAPVQGLYLREDIEIQCNIAMVSFVKSQARAANREMVQRIVKKAELLDAGILEGMIENGKLKTFNPNDRSALGSARPPGGGLAHSASVASSRSSQTASGYPRRDSMQYQAYQPPMLSPTQQQYPTSPRYTVHEAPTHNYPPAPVELPVELPGDQQQPAYYPAKPQAGPIQELPPDYKHFAPVSDPRYSKR